RQSEDFEETLAAPNRSRVFAVDLDCYFDRRQLANDGEEAARRQRGRARLVHVRFKTSTHPDIEIGGGEIDRSLFCLQQDVGKNRQRGSSADDVLNLLQSFEYFLFRRAEFHSESLSSKAL